MDALVGHSGFVGGTLKRQTTFGAHFRSTTIGEIDGSSFGTVVCAAAPAQKWLANRDPEADRATIEALIAHLDTVTCETFVLVSTVDVFADSQGKDEDSPVDDDAEPSYGSNRRLLETFVEGRFAHHLVVRLPGLVGPGLRKNVIYDFLHHNNVDVIDSRGVFQFYPMVNLWFDIQTALAARLSLVHLTAEPVSVAEISALGFGEPFDNVVADVVARYDMQTRHAALYGGTGRYQYSARETIQAVRAYAQSEPRKVS